MDYFKRILGRIFKLRIGGFKTFSRFFLFQSDDDLRKKLKRGRRGFHVDFNRIGMQHMELQELKRAAGFKALMAPQINSSNHYHPLEDHAFDLDDIHTVDSVDDYNERRLAFQQINESRTINL